MSPPHRVLGISENANEEEIKKAYKKLAMKHHPDKGGDEKRFKEITEAYRALTEEKTDESINASDFFSTFFGGNPFGGGPFGGGPFGGGHPFGGGFQHNHHHKNNGKRTTKKHVTISMEEAYTGVTKNIKIEMEDDCNMCVDVCKACEGSGQKQVLRRMQMGHAILVNTTMVKCDECINGKKKRKKSCTTCNDTMITNYKKVVQLIIDPGTMNDKMFKFGNIIPNNEIIFVIHVTPMNGYRVENNHLFYQLHVTLIEAIVGSVLEIDHPSKEKIKFDTSDLSNMLVDKQVITIPRKGMTVHHDLKIIINFKYPKSVNRNVKFINEIQNRLDEYFNY